MFFFNLVSNYRSEGCFYDPGRPASPPNTGTSRPTARQMFAPNILNMLGIWLKLMVSVLVMIALCTGMVLSTLDRNIPAGKERSVVTELVRVR